MQEIVAEDSGLRRGDHGGCAPACVNVIAARVVMVLPNPCGGYGYGYGYNILYPYPYPSVPVPLTRTGYPYPCYCLVGIPLSNITLREPLYLFAIGEWPGELLMCWELNETSDRWTVHQGVQHPCREVQEGMRRRPSSCAVRALGQPHEATHLEDFYYYGFYSGCNFPEPDLVPKRPSPLVFCFSGQGPQHWQQGWDLYYTFRVSHDTIDECDRVHVGCTGESSMETTGLFKPDTPNDPSLAKSLM
ncbi:hypothetical protein BU15DRAFT_69018 [Melanogaster broomeanus]|nr:hypothetical protein BU15DRAFT_69018 [Melanogaster broomeanus]